MIPATHSGFLWTLLPALFFNLRTAAAPTDGSELAISLQVEHLADVHPLQLRLRRRSTCRNYLICIRMTQIHFTSMQDTCLLTLMP